MTDIDWEPILSVCAESTQTTAQVFYSSLFTRPFDSATRQICKVLDSPYRTKAICAFRGSGKTTLAVHPYILRKILFFGHRFIVYGAATSEAAKEKTEEFKYWLDNNLMIKAAFGEVRTGTWSKEGFIVKLGPYDAFILPRGGNTQQIVRGRLKLGRRPDLLIADDIEDPKHITSEDQRIKVRRWFNNELLGSVDRAENYWECLQIGNRQHQDSMLSRALESPVWHSVLLPMCDVEFNSLVPETYTNEDVMKIYQEHLHDDKLDTFYEEYMQNPVPLGKDAAFSLELLKASRYKEASEELWKRKHLENILLIDPARSANMKSSDSALVVVGFDALANTAYIRDIEVGKFHPDEFFDEVGKLVKAWDCRVIGVEVTGLHEFIIHPLSNYLISQKVYAEIIECQSRTGAANNVSGDEKAKVRRTKWLSEWYRRGQIKHEEHIAPMVESLLVSWPKPPRWDVLDALGYLVVVLNQGERFMVPEVDYTLEEALAIEQEYADVMGDYYDEYEYHSLA